MDTRGATPLAGGRRIALWALLVMGGVVGVAIGMGVYTFDYAEGAPPPPPANPPSPAAPEPPAAGGRGENGAGVPNPAPPAVPPIAATLAPHAGTMPRHERFNAISKEGKATLVFLGDSITQGWEGAGKAAWDEHFAPFVAANFGIGGDRTEHVLWRLDHGNFDGLAPALIVVMIGTNNTGARRDAPADTAAGIRAIVEKLRAKCPASRILLLGIFPRGDKPDDALRRLNDEVNARIAPIADGEQVIYKDIGAVFTDESGAPRPDLMPDGLHLNSEGYQLWAGAIRADVTRLMGEGPCAAPPAPLAPPAPPATLAPVKAPPSRA